MCAIVQVLVRMMPHPLQLLPQPPMRLHLHPPPPPPPTTTRAGAAAGGPATAPTTAGATAAPHNPASVAPRGGGGTVLLIDGHSLAHRSYWALNARGGDR